MSFENLQFLSLRYGQFAQVGKPAHATALLCASAVNLFLQMI